MLVCNYSLGIKKCNKKYKTLKGLQKHYDILHKENILKSNPMSSFASYMKNYVRKIDIPANNNPSPISKQHKPLGLIPIKRCIKSSSSVSDSKFRLMENQNKLIISQSKRFSLKVKDLERRLKIVERAERANKKYCVVCWDNESNYALVPCGHKIVCGNCAIAVLGGTRKCPVCSHNVYDLMQIWDGGQPCSEESEESE